MIAAPSCPVPNAPATGSDLDAAAEQLFTSIQFKLDRPLVLRLGADPGIDVSRAETELRVLDLFAVYFAIKTTHCERWKPLGPALFERVCTKVLTWWAPAWDTKDDVVEVLKGRFAAYNRLAEATGPADLDNISLLVGLLCGVMIQGDRRVFADDAETAGQAFTDAVADLRDDNLLHTTAATVFRTRFNAVSELIATLSS